MRSSAPLGKRASRGGYEAVTPDSPEWLAVLQAHVTAVRCNDRAVRLFRAGHLDEAIAELRRGSEANPQYATGYSNLGFLHLRRGQLDEAVECLLRALELDPRHQDAPDHLCDVLRALADELVQIGLSEGFMAMRPGGIFDAHNRHTRTRSIGTLITRIGEKGVFTAEGRVLGSAQLLAVILHDVQRKMGYDRNSLGLPHAWEGIARERQG